MNNDKVQHLRNVPRLRFREYILPWSKVKLKDISVKVGSGSTPRGGSKVYTDTGIPFIRSQNVNNNILSLIDIVYIPKEINLSMQNSQVNACDILLNITGASIGRSCVVPIDFQLGNVNQHVCIIRLNKDDNDPRFIQLFLASSKGQNLVYQSQTGSGREGLNFESIKNFKITIPPKDEQNKIAISINLIDKKIELLEEKLEALKLFKTGLSQKLFNQQIRFKDDDDNYFENWREVRVGQIYKERTERSQGNEILLSVTMNNGVKKRTEIDSKDNSSKDKSNYKLVSTNDMVYNSMRMWQGANGISDYDGIVSPAYTVLCSNLDISNEFFGYLFKTPNMINEFRKYSQGLTKDTWNLKYKQIKDIKFYLPSLPEQQRIAEVLSSIDSTVEVKQTLLETLKQFKKGLLQKMFV